MVAGEDTVSRRRSALYSGRTHSPLTHRLRGTTMTRFRFIAMIVLAAAVGLFLTRPPATDSQEKTIKIGLIFDFSGPFSAAGSLLNYRGVKLAIDWANDKRGVRGKFRIVRVDAGAQSNADVTINEEERLLNAEHVDIL